VFLVIFPQIPIRMVKLRALRALLASTKKQLLRLRAKIVA
jgi:hypothetical protein